MGFVTGLYWKGCLSLKVTRASLLTSSRRLIILFIFISGRCLVHSRVHEGGEGGFGAAPHTILIKKQEEKLAWQGQVVGQVALILFCPAVTVTTDCGLIPTP